MYPFLTAIISHYNESNVEIEGGLFKALKVLLHYEHNHFNIDGTIKGWDSVTIDDFINVYANLGFLSNLNEGEAVNALMRHAINSYEPEKEIIHDLMYSFLT